MAWNPDTETYVEYLVRTGGGDSSDTAPTTNGTRAAAPVGAPTPIAAPGTAAPAAPAVAPAPTSPIGALAANPAYLAFVRASGLADSIATADASDRTFALDRALGIGTEDIEESGRRERRNIAGSHESRGVFRSGQHQTENLESLQDQARRRAALELATADAKGGIQKDLLGVLGGNMTKGAEVALDAGEDDAYRTGLLNLRRTY